jgi:multiple sugar transport system permease protein
MFLNKHLASKNYGMAGALSVYLFVISAILCFIVFKMMQDEDAVEAKKLKKKKRKERA